MCLPEDCNSIFIQLGITILSILSSIALVSNAEDWFGLDIPDSAIGTYVIVSSVISLYLSIRKVYKLQKVI